MRNIRRNARLALSIINQFVPRVHDVSSGLWFYPSAGTDISDINAETDRRVSDFGISPATYYLHSDLFGLKWHAPLDVLVEQKSDLEIVNYTTRKIDEVLSFHHLRARRPNDPRLINILYFDGFTNEEVLRAIISSGRTTEVIFTICDGIVHGMGGSIAREECEPEGIVAAVFYPLIRNVLRIQAIITEHDGVSLGSIIDQGRDTNITEESLSALEGILKASNADSTHIRELINSPALVRQRELRRILIDETTEHEIAVPYHGLGKLFTLRNFRD